MTDHCITSRTFRLPALSCSGCRLLFAVFVLATAPLAVSAQSGSSSGEENESVRLAEEAVRTQDPLLYFQQARKLERMRELAALAQPLDLDALGILEDWLRPVQIQRPDDFSVRSIYFMSRFHRKGFLNRFREAIWSAGGGRSPSGADTLETAVLRGLLQNMYGSPSATLLDVPAERRRSDVDHVQFEYYFVVNDTIPVMVMDIDGPRETGLLLAVDLDDLPVYNDVRKAILDRILTATEPDPYIDYYFDPTENIWYESGFDGEHYFVEEIRKPRHAWERPYLRLSDSKR